ncbi:MAG: radical SAM protein [Prevotellaceae bacterium]|jgi:organic radical activating enzyme|nr:radical SAM protein [Prevotellaceae bacterium]
MIKKIIPHQWVLFYRSLKPLFRKITRKNRQKKAVIPILHIHLADHCNLNCRGCDNFSPLSPEIFADLAVVENDCKRISELSGGKVGEIQLLGGEPLLHQQVIDFLNVARKYFPAVPVKLITNGVLLLKQKENFWEACRRNNIEIVVTKYPIKINHEALEKRAKEAGVKFSFYGTTAEIEKNMQCMPLDLSGSQDARDSFLRCSSANNCIAMDNGKIYTCTTIPYVKYFNAHFKKNLPVTENDYIDIYKAKSMDEILEFIAKPMPFCRFCHQKGIIYDTGFGVSKKEISEWTGA